MARIAGRRYRRRQDVAEEKGGEVKFGRHKEGAWDSTMSDRSRLRRLRSCFVSAIAVPTILALILATIYVVNNRTPDITFPPHPMPTENALDDFVRASEMARSITHKAPAS